MLFLVRKALGKTKNLKAKDFAVNPTNLQI